MNKSLNELLNELESKDYTSKTGLLLEQDYAFTQIVKMAKKYQEYSTMKTVAVANESKDVRYRYFVSFSHSKGNGMTEIISKSELKNYEQYQHIVSYIQMALNIDNVIIFNAQLLNVETAE